MYAYGWIHVHVHQRIVAYMYICVCVLLHICTYICVYCCVHVHICPHIVVLFNTCTYICTYCGMNSSVNEAIFWTNAVSLLIEQLGTNFSEIFIENHTFSLKKSIWKCRYKMASILSQPQNVKTLSTICIRQYNNQLSRSRDFYYNNAISRAVVGPIMNLLSLHDLEIVLMTLKNNRALLCPSKLCVLFYSILGIIIQKCSSWEKFV